MIPEFISYEKNTLKVCVGKNNKKYIFVKPLHRYWKKELCSLNIEKTSNNEQSQSTSTNESTG